MSTMQTGSWRKDAEGIYRVFISGPKQSEGTMVEVLARYGDPKYVILVGKHSTIKGGNLYTFKYIRKPEPTSSATLIGTPQVRTGAIGEEVSAEELDTTLGLD